METRRTSSVLSTACEILFFLTLLVGVPIFCMAVIHAVDPVKFEEFLADRDRYIDENNYPF
jgi:hypothetical protein